MKHTPLIIILLLFTHQFIIAQDGDFFNTRYTPQINDIDHTYFDIGFSQNDELVAANRSGLLLFDGLDWTLIPSPSAVLSLLISAEDIYIGCAGDFGKIDLINGVQAFRSLKNDSSASIVYQIISKGEDIYFLTEESINIYNENSDSSYQVVPDSDTYLEYIFEFKEDVFVVAGLTTYLVNNSLDTVASPLPNNGTVTYVSKNQSLDKYILADQEGNIYLYDNGFNELTGLNQPIVTGIEWLNDFQIAISTLSDGIIFYDFSDNIVYGEVDGAKGLTDNEIYAIAADHYGGLWVANEFGFTRIAPNLPLKVFNYYPGLEGNLISAKYFEDKWFVGTSKGVYYFDEEEKYKNIVYYVPRTSTRTSTRTTAKTKKENSIVRLVDQNPFKKKKKTNPFTRKTGNSNFNIKKSSPNKSKGILSVFSNIGKQKPQYIRKVRKELIATNHLYKSVEGLSEKSKELLIFDDRLIAVTPSGIVEINDKTATFIYEKPVQTILHPKSTNLLFLSNVDGGITILEKDKDVWMELGAFETPGEIILSMYEDSNSQIWMAGANSLFKGTLKDSASFIDKTYPLQNHFFDQVRIAEINDTLYIVNNIGYFYFDESSNSLKSDNQLKATIGKPLKHLLQTDGRIWIHNGTNWVRIEKDKSTSIYTYLKLVPEMSFVDQIGDDLWIVDSNEKLYKYSPNENDSIPAGNMYYKEIRGRKGLIKPSEDVVKFEYENNSFHIEIARPDYLGLLNVEYQYILVGLSETWSEWTKNNHIDFSYLPAGNYTLSVKSRDKFGRIQQLAPFNFKIVPPYWETVWFNAAEIIFFTILVFGSAKLNQKGGDRHRLFTSLLTVVTVVMIIEFLQNLAGSYLGEMSSPVLAFAIDVFVALLVFPIEQLLKKVVEGKLKVTNPLIAK